MHESLSELPVGRIGHAAARVNPSTFSPECLLRNPLKETSEGFIIFYFEWNPIPRLQDLVSDW